MHKGLGAKGDPRREWKGDQYDLLGVLGAEDWIRGQEARKLGE